MVSTAIAAFVMGAIGSFHCIGMCGPLALALPLKDNCLFSKFTGALLYNSGRIIAYSLLGLAAGIIGQGFSLFGFQQWLSIIAGVIILLFLVLPHFFPSVSTKLKSRNRFFERIRKFFGTLFLQKKQSTLFAIGFLNGWLPCGLVYLALAGATATGKISSAVLFMAFFGAGTLPVMWSIAFWGNFINLSIRQRIRNMYPYLMLLMACLLIVRGIGLGIPYLSPVQNDNSKKISCCAKP